MSTPQPANTPVTTTASKTRGVLSLIFGIISVAFCLFLPIIWILFGIAAVVLGFLSRRSEPGAAKIALAGIITGFIGIALNIGSMIVGAVVVSQYMA